MIRLKRIQLDESANTGDYTLTIGFNNDRFQQVRFKMDNSPQQIALQLYEFSKNIGNDEELKD